MQEREALLGREGKVSGTALVLIRMGGKKIGIRVVGIWQKQQQQGREALRNRGQVMESRVGWKKGATKTMLEGKLRRGWTLASWPIRPTLGMDLKLIER